MHIEGSDEIEIETRIWRSGRFELAGHFVGIAGAGAGGGLGRGAGLGRGPAGAPDGLVLNERGLDVRLDEIARRARGTPRSESANAIYSTTSTSSG